jgi:perosamine synthetase
MQKMILTAGPSITQKEIEYVLDAVRYGWNENWNLYLRRFEASFAAYVGTRFALATSSCTGALHLALLGLGVGPGDEVLVPEISWIATASAVTYCGATPVFVDVDPETWCMDVASTARAVTPRTRVILPVHLYGHPANMVAVNQLARAHGLAVLEDAAPALGAEVNCRKVGGLGRVGAFSFQGAKLLVTGEGGMLVTDDAELFERISRLADHGRDPDRPLHIRTIGHKYKMSNLQAALGLAQLERIDELVRKKRLIFEWYRQRLGQVPGLTLNAEKHWARNTYWMTSVVLSEQHDVSRDTVIAQLKQRHIDSRPFFPPMSSFPMFKSRSEDNPVAYRIARQGLNLPSGHNLTEGDVDRVCRSLVDILQGRGRQAA